MKSVNWVLNFLLLLGMSTAVAKEIVYKPLELAMDGVEQIVVLGQVGDVRLVAGKGPGLTVKVVQSYSSPQPASFSSRLDEWNFVAQRQGAKILMQVQGPHERDFWAEWLSSKDAPRFDLEIVGPSRPVDLSLYRGQVIVDKWTSSVRLAVQAGGVRVLGGEGDLHVMGQSTDVAVESRKGKVVLDIFSGKVLLKAHKGRVWLENFMGESTLAQVEGALELKTYKGVMKVEGGQGQIDFALAQGQLRLGGFEGGLRGVADQGSVSGKLLGATEVRISTGDGAVNLELPGSGANLSLSSKEGAITGPPHLRSDLLGGRRVLRGRLKGGQDGLVIVKTESGPIRVR